MGVGRIEKGDSEIDRRSFLNNGSRQCVVERYIFGSQPCVEKDITHEVGGPRDVKTQAQVSKKTSGGRDEEVTRCIESGEGSLEEESV